MFHHIDTVEALQHMAQMRKNCGLVVHANMHMIPARSSACNDMLPGCNEYINYNDVAPFLDYIERMIF